MILDSKGNPHKFWKNRATQYDPNIGINPYANQTAPDDSIINDIDSQRMLAEELFANHPIIKAVINNIVSHASITDYTITFDTGNADLDDELKKHWNRWSKKYIDTTGKWNLNQLCEINLRNYLLYGESFGLAVNPKFGTSEKPSPYDIAFRGVSPTRVKNPSNKTKRPSNRTIKAGIEIDNYGVARRLWMRGNNGKFNSVPWTDADNNPLVFHIMEPTFFDQTHGMVPITTVYRQALDLSIFMQSEVKAAVNSSQINIIATMNKPERANAISQGNINVGGNTVDDPPIYKPIIPVNPGDMFQLLPGESIEQLKLDRPNAMMEPFVRFNLDIICRCFNVDYKYIFAEWQDSNYSSARLAALQTQGQLFKLQKTMVNRFIEPLTDYFIRTLVMDDKVDIGNMDIEDILDSYTIRTPKMPLIDPSKEAATSALLIEKNLSTHEREIERLNGEDYQDIFSQLGREKEMLSENSLTDENEINPDNPTGEQGRPASEGSTRS